jgi:hypothetical protein
MPEFERARSPVLLHVVHVTCYDFPRCSRHFPNPNRPIADLPVSTLRVIPVEIHKLISGPMKRAPAATRAAIAACSSRQRAPNLCASDRFLAGLLALLVRPTRLLRSAIVLKPSTRLALHKAMSKQKYRMLFSPIRRRKPGPKGPSAELAHAVVHMKPRIPHGKGERPRYRCHDQLQISARFDGNHTVDPYIRLQWLPDFSKTRAYCCIRSTPAKNLE